MYTYIELFPSPIGVLYISMRDTVANELERDFRPLLEFFIFQYGRPYIDCALDVNFRPLLEFFIFQL